MQKSSKFVFSSISIEQTDIDTSLLCLQEKVLEASDILKEKATEAAKAGSEYAEVFGEKAASAAEAGNEYLAHGAEVVKEYAT